MEHKQKDTDRFSERESRYVSRDVWKEIFSSVTYERESRKTIDSLRFLVTDRHCPIDPLCFW